MKKVVLFAFNGESMCFAHVLLNGLDMKEKGYDIKIVIEGAATGLVPAMLQNGNMLNQLYKKAKNLGIIEGACKACSIKMGTLEAIETEGIPILEDMSGHPSFSQYQMRGYEIITF